MLWFYITSATGGLTHRGVEGTQNSTSLRCQVSQGNTVLVSRVHVTDNESIENTAALGSTPKKPYLVARRQGTRKQKELTGKRGPRQHSPLRTRQHSPSTTTGPTDTCAEYCVFLFEAKTVNCFCLEFSGCDYCVCDRFWLGFLVVLAFSHLLEASATRFSIEARSDFPQLMSAYSPSPALVFRRRRWKATSAASATTPKAPAATNVEETPSTLSDTVLLVVIPILALIAAMLSICCRATRRH
jgi:hypothetical protein